MACFQDLPPEILRIIAQLIYLDHIPRSIFRCLDPHGLPSTYPDARLISSTQFLTQSTLHALCLINSSGYHAAKPLLWRRLQIKLPYSFLLLLRSLGVSRLAEAYEAQQQLDDGEGESDGDDVLDIAASEATRSAEDIDFNAMLTAVGLARVTGDNVFSSKNLAAEGQDLDLVWNEETTPDDAGSRPRFHVTFRHDDIDLGTAHRYPRVLDFSTFTTQGMRRTVGEGQDARFVTSAKLLALITAVSSGLMAFGASSSMDSALSLEVLEALLFRDSEGSDIKSHRKLRGVSIERSAERGDAAKRRRRLEALDLCNCGSIHFEAALRRFVDRHLRKFSGRTTGTVQEEGGENNPSEQDVSEVDVRGRSRSRRRDASRPSAASGSRSLSTRRPSASRHPARQTFFPSVERLCLHGLHFSADLLTPFVLAFPCLTHLDLSGTKIDDRLLEALGASPDLELESLSLARCPRITSSAITDLIVDSQVCADLVELSLEGSILFPTPILHDDLKILITTAPCMRSGSLRYLDLGGCGLTDELVELIPRQPSLLDLGLSASPSLTLDALAQFLMERAPNVQILELVDSCHHYRELMMSVMRLNWALLEPCTTVPPMSISEQLEAMGFAAAAKDGGQDPPQERKPPPAPRTNLRVVGLSRASLRNFGGALGSWRVVFGKGQRGWLVDTSSGPNPEAVDEDLGQSAVSETSFQDVDASGPLSGVAAQLARGRDGRRTREDDEERGRDTWRREPIAGFEPETPPRRASRSPSVGASRRRSSKVGSVVGLGAAAGNGRASLLRRATSQSQSQSQSRSRSRQPSDRPAIDEMTQHPTAHHSGATMENASGGERMEEEGGDHDRVERDDHVVRNLPETHPRVQVLRQLARANGHVPGTTGWHSKKMEVLLGYGMLGRESGQYAYAAYQA